MSESDQKPKRKRRWPRFSLRLFLIVVTLLCVWLAWFVYRVERQREAVAWVEANGGTVYYDFEFHPVVGLYDGQPPGPRWLRDILGVDYFSSVVCVFVSNEPVDDLRPLLALRKSHSTQIINCWITEIKNCGVFAEGPTGIVNAGVNT